MADIKLKDIGGEEKTYSGIKHVKIPSSTGEQVEFDLEPTLQEKSIENKKNGVTEVSADTGYDGLSKVTVKTSVPPTMQDYRLLIPSRQPQKSDWEEGATIYQLFESTANDTGGIFNGLLGIVGFADGQPPVVNIANFGGFTPTGIPSDAFLFYSWQELNAAQLATYQFGGLSYTYADTAVIPVGWSYPVFGENGNITSFISINTDTARLPIGSDAYDGKYFNNYFYELFTLVNIEDKVVSVIQNGTTTIRADHAALGIHQVNLSVDVPQTPTEEKTVALSMSSGNQVVTPSGGKVLSKVTVTKPDTMLPENIKNGINIGGVVGTLVSGGGETEEVTVDLSMADGNQVITPSAGKSISKATVTKPSTLIPANIKKDVVIGGVTGTLDSGGGGGVDVSDFGDAAGEGCVIISPDRLSITVYGKRGTANPISIDDNLAFSLNDHLTPLQPNVLSKLNSWAAELMTAGTTANNNFNDIFGTADKALFMNDVRGDCEVPKFLETDTKDWAGLLGALRRSLANISGNQGSWKSIGYDEYCVSYDNALSAVNSAKVKYQYCWSVPSSTAHGDVVAYNLKTPTAQMPVYENGMYQCSANTVYCTAFNANFAGNIYELLFFMDAWSFGAHVYSPNAQTIPSAFIEAVFGQSGVPDMAVQAGWGSVSTSDLSYAAETEQELQSIVSAKDGIFTKFFLVADDYIRSALLPITGTSYSNDRAQRLELIFNLVAETT